LTSSSLLLPSSHSSHSLPLLSAVNTCETARQKGENRVNTPLEYILVGIVALAVTVYLVIALLAPEKF